MRGAQKNRLQPWKVRSWCLKTEPDSDFVYLMEAVLDTYQRPLDSTRPVVCVDEVPQVLHLKWDTPSFSPYGNLLVLPTFQAIELLRDSCWA